MRYLLKYLQRVGLVSVLLVGGVLGGLMAPLPSDAVPTLTLRIDGLPLQKTTNGSTFTDVANNSILGGSVACNATDTGLGYTACYSIVTSTTTAYKANNGRLYRIQNASGATARLRVGDNLGTDYFSLVGVQFVPVSTANQRAALAGDLVNTLTDWGRDANATETHTLALTMDNSFNGSVNVNNATQFNTDGTPVENTRATFAIRNGVQFQSGRVSTPVATTTLYCGSAQTPARCNTVGDSVAYSGTGIFIGTLAVPIISSGAGANSQPLSFTVGDTSNNRSITNLSVDGLTNATLGQVDPTYPRFNCVDNRTPATSKCQPRITLTMTVTLKGPDAFVIENGQESFGAICNTQDNSRLTRLFTFLTNVVALLDRFESKHNNAKLRAWINEANTFLVNFNTTPSDPNCPATKLIQAQMLYNALIDQVAFAAAGAVPGDPAPPSTITITKNTSQGTSATFDFGITGPSSSTASISMGGQNSKTTVVTVDAGTYNIAESPTSGWTLNNVSCGENGDPVSDGVVGVDVPLGGNVTCTFNNNKALSSYNYQKVDSPGITWTAARAAALLLPPTGSWDLATITSAAEQAFIQTLLPALYELPATDYWIGGEQPDCTPEPGCNWRWATTGQVFYDGVPIGYANWGTASTGPADEPNNYFGPGEDNENHVTMDSRYGWGWNDLPGGFSTKGYVAERVSP